MAENQVNENSLLKIKSIIKMWLERKGSKLIFCPFGLTPLSPDVELNEYFQSLTYDGRIIKEFVRCQKCEVLISKQGNRKFNLKRHMNFHKNVKSTTEIDTSIISTGNPLTSILNISNDSGVDATHDVEPNAIPMEVGPRATTRLSNNSDDNDVWFDALESL